MDEARLLFGRELVVAKNGSPFGKEASSRIGWTFASGHVFPRWECDISQNTPIVPHRARREHAQASAVGSCFFDRPANTLGPVRSQAFDKTLKPTDLQEGS
jgi:hypothetical protein